MAGRLPSPVVIGFEWRVWHRPHGRRTASWLHPPPLRQSRSRINSRSTLGQRHVSNAAMDAVGDGVDPVPSDDDRRARIGPPWRALDPPGSVRRRVGCGRPPPGLPDRSGLSMGGHLDAPRWWRRVGRAPGRRRAPGAHRGDGPHGADRAHPGHRLAHHRPARPAVQARPTSWPSSIGSATSGASCGWRRTAHRTPAHGCQPPSSRTCLTCHSSIGRWHRSLRSRDPVGCTAALWPVRYPRRG